MDFIRENLWEITAVTMWLLMTAKQIGRPITAWYMMVTTIVLASTITWALVYFVA